MSSSSETYRNTDEMEKTMSSVNQEFVSTLNETKEVVVEAIKSDNSNVFTIGDALSKAVEVVENQEKRKDKAAYKAAYEAIFDDLYFSAAVAKKFIKISKCDYLRELHEDEKTSKNLLWSYTSLYELAAAKIADSEENVKIIQDVFTAGLATLANDEVKSSRKLTLNDIRFLTNQIASNDNAASNDDLANDDSESEQTREESIISNIIRVIDVADEHLREAFIQEIEKVVEKYNSALNQSKAA